MKAKDLKKELSKINKKHWDIIFANPKEYSKLYKIYVMEMQGLMIEYAKAKCKEQRKLCQEMYNQDLEIADNYFYCDSRYFINAPTPDFE